MPPVAAELRPPSVERKRVEVRPDERRLPQGVRLVDEEEEGVASGREGVDARVRVLE